MANNNAQKTKQIKVTPEVLAKLQNAQFQPQAPVYDMNDTLVSIPSGQYSVESRPVAATATRKAWTAHEAVFTVNGQTFRVRYRSGVTPDEDQDIAIGEFIANRNWPSDTDIQVAKGKEMIFAINEG